MTTNITNYSSGVTRFSKPLNTVKSSSSIGTSSGTPISDIAFPKCDKNIGMSFFASEGIRNRRVGTSVSGYEDRGSYELRVVLPGLVHSSFAYVVIVILIAFVLLVLGFVLGVIVGYA